MVCRKALTVKKERRNEDKDFHQGVGMQTVFKMQFRDATRAIEEVWQRQNTAGNEPSTYQIVAVRSDTSVTPDDEEGEAILREVLGELGIDFEE